MDNSLALKDNTFEPTSTGLIVHGEPTFDDWDLYGKKLAFIEGAIQWLIGDWLNYGDRKFGEMCTQAIDERGFPQWRDYKYVSSQVNLSLRNDKLTWSHHREIAKLNEGQQAEWLERAEDNNWTVRELRQNLVYSNKMLPEPVDGKFKVIYADPPWDYSNSGFDMSAASIYPTMSIEEICGLKIGELLIRDLADIPCALLLWATSPLLPSALDETIRSILKSYNVEYMEIKR